MAKSFSELLEDLQSGREVRQAQEAFYRSASSALLEPLRARIPLKVRGRLDAEDVLHEAVVRALNHVGQAEFASERQFLAWVYRIARNLMTDQAKRMSAAAVPWARDSQSAPPLAGPRLSEVAAAGKTAESNVARREVVDKALAELPASEAEVIRRRWISGESFAEIANSLRRTPKAVKGIYTRAWKRLQKVTRRIEP